MTARPTIRFLIPYFGEWPFWMPFFVASCRANPDIDWLFFTDCGLLPDAPDNVHIEAMSFVEYCCLVGDRLELDFRPRSAYKLCDIKPALGHIHADRLDGFDFWGFSDIDLVYGNLRAYFSDERLARYDLLSTHERRVSGHLCLLRNSARMLEAFKRIPGWRESLKDDEHLAFDEGAFSRLFIRYKNWPGGVRRLIERLNPWRQRSEFIEAYSTPNGRIPWIDGSLEFPTRWIWRNGSLRNDRDGNREFPYLHFITWKGEWKQYPAESLVQPTDLSEQPAWCVTALGFREA